MSDNTAKVIKYECMYTSDTKKAKVWHDGKGSVPTKHPIRSITALRRRKAVVEWSASCHAHAFDARPLRQDDALISLSHAGYLRLHHYNSKLILFSTAQEELASTFYRPPAFLTARINGQSGGGRPLSDDFRFKEGDAVELDDGWRAELGEVVFESETNVSEIFKQTQTARKAASKDAQAWALSVDAKEPSGSRNMFGGTPSFIATPLRSQQEPSTLLSTSKSLYKGFNVPPPRSYTDKNTTKPSLTKSNPTSKSSWTGSTPSKFSNTTPRPPSRTLPLTAHNAATSTPRAKPYDRPATSTSQSSKSSFPASPYVITNSPSVASPFRPPSFIRPSPGGSGVGTPGRPSSAMSRLEEFKFRES